MSRPALPSHMDQERSPSGPRRTEEDPVNAKEIADRYYDAWINRAGDFADVPQTDRKSKVSDPPDMARRRVT